MINSDVNRSNSNQTYSQNEINQKKEKINVVFANKCTENELECKVCLDPIKDATTIKCLHVFCKACIEETLASKWPCPECRDLFTAQEMKHDFRIQKIIDRLWCETCKNEGLENEPNPYKHVEVANNQKEEAKPQVIERPSLPAQNNINQQNPQPVFIYNTNNVVLGNGHLGLQMDQNDDLENGYPHKRSKVANNQKQDSQPLFIVNSNNLVLGNLGPKIDRNGNFNYNQGFNSAHSIPVNSTESVDKKIKSIVEQFEKNKDKNALLNQLFDLSNENPQNENLKAIIETYFDEGDDVVSKNTNNSPKQEVKQSSKINNNMPQQVGNQPSIQPSANLQREAEQRHFEAQQMQLEALKRQRAQLMQLETQQMQREAQFQQVQQVRQQVQQQVQQIMQLETQQMQIEEIEAQLQQVQQARQRVLQVREQVLQTRQQMFQGNMGMGK